jgi:hypothetical protein
LMSSFASCENAASGIASSRPKHSLQTNVRISKFPPGVLKPTPLACVAERRKSRPPARESLCM